jgi:hypothetical protein
MQRAILNIRLNVHINDRISLTSQYYTTLLPFVKNFLVMWRSCCYKQGVKHVKLPLLILGIGLILTCGSIVIGKKSAFHNCEYFGYYNLHVVDRGAPFAYFRVDPSESTCVSVDSVGAVFASDAGNDVSSKALFADWLIWTVIAGLVLVALHARKSK